MLSTCNKVPSDYDTYVMASGTLDLHTYISSYFISNNKNWISISLYAMILSSLSFSLYIVRKALDCESLISETLMFSEGEH
jgi:hypothetical protein